MKYNFSFLAFLTIFFIAAILILYDWRYLIVFIITLILIFVIIKIILKKISYLTIHQFTILNKELQLKQTILVPTLLSFDKYLPTLQGSFLGQYLKIFMYTKLEPNERKFPYTEIHTDIINYDKTFTLTTQGIYTSYKKYFYNTTKITGDPEFDRRFFVKSSHPDFIADLFDDEIRNYLKKDVFLKMGTFNLEQSLLKYTEQIAITTENERHRLEEIIAVMLMMTQKMKHKRNLITENFYAIYQSLIPIFEQNGANLMFTNNIFPSIEGLYLNNSIKIFMYGKQIKNTLQPTTAIIADISHYGNVFTIASNANFKKENKEIEHKKISTGNKIIDTLYTIDTNSPSWLLSKVLASEVVEMLSNPVLVKAKTRPPTFFEKFINNKPIITEHYLSGFTTITVQKSQLYYEEPLAINNIVQQQRFLHLIKIMLKILSNVSQY